MFSDYRVYPTVYLRDVLNHGWSCDEGHLLYRMVFQKCHENGRKRRKIAKKDQK